jgi:hypothetical protein
VIGRVGGDATPSWSDGGAWVAELGGGKRRDVLAGCDREEDASLLLSSLVDPEVILGWVHT